MATARHALTAGSIGTMMLAVMSRATLGHTGCPLTADR
ncbi:NnrS family protein [Nitrospirillum amazonense]|nr:NnrS family protein [Nitrospirillum amazonense]MDG3442532.1 NnrS family protein [Nitrospirillum amazonense]